MTAPKSLRLNAGEVITDLPLYLAAQQARAGKRGYAGKIAAEHIEIVNNLIEKENEQK